MQSENPLIADVAKLLNSAAGTVAGMGREARDAARERLKVIYETTDGFEVARRDLQLRGPGEFLGARQAGLPLLRFASLDDDAALVEQAAQAAEVMLREHPVAAAAHVKRWMGARAAMLDA